MSKNYCSECSCKSCVAERERVVFWRDEDAECPFEWRPEWTLYTRDRNTRLGKYAAELVTTAKPGFKLYPVYRYEHSGTALSLNDFVDPWDSGLWGVLEVPLDLTKDAVEAFIEELEAWINGEVYGYTLPESKGGYSVGGFYDFADMARETGVPEGDIELET